jgi:single-strand DNA-binding protein
VNRIIVEGNLGRPPEMFDAKSGMKIARFSVADSYRKDKESPEITTWFNVVAFGKVAEGCASLDKGQRVIVEGRLQEEEYEKDGQKKKVIKLLANSVSVSVVARGPSGGVTTETIDKKVADAELDSIPF